MLSLLSTTRVFWVPSFLSPGLREVLLIPTPQLPLTEDSNCTWFTNGADRVRLQVHSGEGQTISHRFPILPSAKTTRKRGLYRMPTGYTIHS